MRLPQPAPGGWDHFAPRNDDKVLAKPSKCKIHAQRELTKVQYSDIMVCWLWMQKKSYRASKEAESEEL